MLYYSIQRKNIMYMNKKNIVGQLNQVLELLQEIDRPEVGVILKELAQSRSLLQEVIDQLDKYKLFIDVRDDDPLGRIENGSVMNVDSPFNDGNPVNIDLGTIEGFENDD